jgi:hypothetical protein
MARLGRSSPFSDGLYRLFYGAPNRRARRELGRKASSTRPAGLSRRRVRPCLETLEDRITPAPLSPTVFDDPKGATDSLRGVITQANSEGAVGTVTIQLQAGTYTLRANGKNYSVAADRATINGSCPGGFCRETTFHRASATRGNLGDL